MSIEANGMTSRQESFYAGVDAGASYTRAVIVDAGGRERGRGAAAGANPGAAGWDVALGNIKSAVERAAGEAGIALPLAGAWCGVSGVDRPHYYETMLPLLQVIASSVRLTNDAELGLAALPGALGICLIAGTGSIAVGRDSAGKVARAGGWGHLLGDEGSAYDIGRLALQAVTRAADGRAPVTALKSAILGAWGLETERELLDRVYPVRDKSTIAGLAGLVFDTATAGDVAAQRIVAHAASELAALVSAAATQLSFSGSLSLALVGGVLTGRPEMRRALMRRLGRRRAVGPVVVVTDPALVAAQAAASGVIVV